MDPTFARVPVQYDFMVVNDPLSGLAGVQLKFGARRVAGEGPITGTALLANGDPAVVVGGVGVPLDQVRYSDGTAPDPAQLAAWWDREVAAWCARHGGVAHTDRGAILAEVRRLRGSA